MLGTVSLASWDEAAVPYGNLAAKPVLAFLGLGGYGFKVEGVRV